jgi:hypothetical protein
VLRSVLTFVSAIVNMVGLLRGLLMGTFLVCEVFQLINNFSLPLLRLLFSAVFSPWLPRRSAWRPLGLPPWHPDLEERCFDRTVGQYIQKLRHDNLIRAEDAISVRLSGFKSANALAPTL